MVEVSEELVRWLGVSGQWPVWSLATLMYGRGGV